jgi:hypothetical protein
MNESELKGHLESRGVSTAEWGKGKAKTLGHLLKEIEAGETVLETKTYGQLLRRTAFLAIEVLYKDDAGAKRYKLIEERQVFTDGRERRRENWWSVAEKLKAGEVDILEATRRALKEELGVDGEFRSWSQIETRVEKTDSPSYPGLKAQFTTFHLIISLNDCQFKPEGYIEVQKDKTTYFTWVFTW